MIGYFLMGATPLLMIFLYKLWQKNINLHQEELEAIRINLRKSLDFEANQVKQAFSDEIDSILHAVGVGDFNGNKKL